MRAGRVLLLSAVVHAAAAAVLSQVVLEGKRAAVGRAPEEPAPPEPIEVAFLDLTPAVASAAVATAPAPGGSIGSVHAHAAHRSPGASASIATGTGDAIANTHETAPGNGTSLMHMRGPDLDLDAGTAQRIAESGAHELPPETKISGKLQHVSGGKAVVYDRVTTMSVEQDGSAHFDDKPDIDLKLKLPVPHLDVEGARKDLGKLLTDWYADPYAGTRFGRSQELSNINLAVPGACDEWGNIWCDDPLAPDSEKYAREQKKTNGSLLGGPADITAYLMRKFKVGDPYASRKLKLLDDTRDERVAMGTAFRAQQMERSAELIQRNLVRLSRARLSAIEKRAAAFELWDECAEPRNTDDADAELDREGQAGQRARAQVIGWIRSHLPQGGPDAYTDEEIERLNLHRASKQRFEPY